MLSCSANAHRKLTSLRKVATFWRTSPVGLFSFTKEPVLGDVEVPGWRRNWLHLLLGQKPEGGKVGQADLYAAAGRACQPPAGGSG